MKKITLLFTVVVWFSLVLGGTFFLMKYQSAPGNDRFAPPKTFPPASRLALDPEHPTLILFAHPQCPCTRASLRELERLAAKNQGEIKVYVVFVKPAEMPTEWTESDLKESARKIPGAEVVVDENEMETSLFNAQTSGLTLLYDTSGILHFRGGITFGRGMEGDNQGIEIISAILRGESPADNATPVFGCALQNKEIEIQ